MINSTQFKSFVLAMLFGFSSYWLAWYVQIFNSTDFLNLGITSRYEEACSAPSTNQSLCTNSYKIPLRTMDMKERWLGVGSLISATRFKCQSGKVIKEYDDPVNPGARFDLMTLYQRTQVPDDCGSYLEVQAWSRPTAVRKGHLDGAAVLGSRESVEAMARLHEFFGHEFVRILTYIFLFVAVIQMMSKNFYGRTLQIGYFGRHIWLWVAFLFFASNLGQTLIPIQKNPLFFNKLIAILSMLAFTLPITSILLNKYSLNSEKTWYKKIDWLVLAIACTFALTRYFSWVFITVAICVTLLSLYSAYKTRDSLFAFYAAILTLGTLKIINMPFLFNSMTIAFFVGSILCFETIEAIVKLSRLIGRINQISVLKNSDGNHNLDFAEKELFNLLDVNQLSFLYILPDSRCEIRIYRKFGDKIDREVFQRQELPPVFAHVISNREPIWNCNSQSPKIRDLKSNSDFLNLYSGELFSVVPLLDNKECFGAFAYTNYLQEKHQTSNTLFDQKMISEIATPTLISKFSQWRSAQEVQNLKGFNNLSSRLTNLFEQTDVSLELLLKSALLEINNFLGSMGFIASLDSESRQIQILAIENYSEEIKNRYLNGKIYAHTNNEQGPLPISINKQKVVIIENVKLHAGVFHEFTNYFFRVSQTNSCSSIPLYLHGNAAEEKTVWGVLFLEAARLVHFKMALQPILEKIGELMSQKISLRESSKNLSHTRRALEGFIPKEYVQSYLGQEKINIQASGYLVMIDLKSSTKVSNRIGADKWLELVELELKPKICAIASSFNLEFVSFNWDAFYLSRKSSGNSPEDYQQIFKFICRTITILDRFYSLHFSDYFYEFKNENSPKARYCLSYGDISMGIVESGKSYWTIIGQEMANITKMESLAKTWQKENPYSIIYSDSSLATILDQNSKWRKSENIIPESGREMYYLESSWDDLRKSIEAFPTIEQNHRKVA
jgi:hypothetical protein